MAKIPDVIWVIQGTVPAVAHLFECWVDGMSYERLTTPICGEPNEAIVYRLDGAFCRYCVAMEGLLS